MQNKHINFKKQSNEKLIYLNLSNIQLYLFDKNRWFVHAHVCGIIKFYSNNYQSF